MRAKRKIVGVGICLVIILGYSFMAIASTAVATWKYNSYISMKGQIETVSSTLLKDEARAYTEYVGNVDTDAKARIYLYDSNGEHLASSNWYSGEHCVYTIWIKAYSASKGKSLHNLNNRYGDVWSSPKTLTASID